MKLELETYSASEAAEITGLAMDAQRNWRRRGYLPKQKGHGKFTLPDLAVFAVMAQLSERGIGPNVSQAFAEEAKRAIYLTALNFGVFSEGAMAEGVARFEPEVAAAIVERFDAFDTIEEARAYENYQDIMKAHVGMRLHDVFAKQEGVFGAVLPKYFIIWADGTPEFVSADEPFGDEDVLFRDPRRQGFIQLLTIGAIAWKLVSRLPRPAIKLEGEAQ